MSQLHCVLQFRVALVCVLLLCFATQGCAGLRHLIMFCTSGLRWFASSYCVLHLRVVLVCVFLSCIAVQSLLVCVFFLCIAVQGCPGLRILMVFCISGLCWSAYAYYVLQFRVALVCVFLSCSAILGCTGLSSTHVVVLCSTR